MSRSLLRPAFFAPLLAAALGACHSGSAAPVINSFTADTNPLTPGNVEALRWNVSNADSLTIDNGVGDVTGKTSVNVAPTSATTYTLTATNKSHPQGVTASVTVTLSTGAAIVYFTATPSQVVPGTPVTLTWSVKNATALSVDGQPVTGNSLQVNATATATHTLTATGPSGGTPATAKAVVRVVAPPSIASFTATPSTLNQGQSTVLSWTGNALSWSLDNNVGDQGAQTKTTVRPSTTTTYTLTARGAAGTKQTATQTVTVNPNAGTRALQYNDPIALPVGTPLALKRDSSSTGALLLLNVVTVQSVTANALAFDIPIDSSKVALDSLKGGDLSPGFSVAGTLNPGSNPPAAKASLATSGPLVNVLTVGLAQKAAGSGAVTGDANIPAGSVICTLRLVPIATAAPGAVMPPNFGQPDPSDVYQPYKLLLRGTSSSSTKIALGTLTLQ